MNGNWNRQAFGSQEHVEQSAYISDFQASRSKVLTALTQYIDSPDIIAASSILCKVCQALLLFLHSQEYTC